MPDITMNIDDTLELDTVIREDISAKDPVEVTDGTDYNMNGIQTKTAIFDPQSSGDYTIKVNGKELSIKVNDSTTIPESEVYYKLTDGDFKDDSKNENDATANGDYTFVSGGIQFNGTSTIDYAKSPDVGLNNDDTATIGVEIIPQTNLTSSSSGRGWVGVHKGNNGWVLGYEGGDIVLQSMSKSNIQDTLRYSVDLNKGTNYTIGARSDNRFWDIFLGGASVASLSASSGPKLANSGALFLASWSGGGGAFTGSGATSTMSYVWAADRAVSDINIP